MFKKSIILMIIIILCVGLASAASVTVTLNSPTTATVLDSSSVIYNVTASGNSSTWKCVLYSDDDGTWTARETDSSVTNNTVTSFSTRTVSEKTGTTAYNWNVFCNSTNDVAGAWAASNSTFGVDTTVPTFSVIYPTTILTGVTTSEWISGALGDDSVRLGATVTDNNADKCIFYLGYNLTSNVSTGNNHSYCVYPYGYTNATAFNFTQVNATNGFIDNNTGIEWAIVCNDSAGNDAMISGTFKVDDTLPSAFTFNTSLWQTDSVTLWNDTSATDYTPQIGWSLTTETNFNRYRIRFYDTFYGNATYVEKDETTISTLYSSMSELVADTSYFILVTAYDLAGNARNMTKLNYKYSTTSIGHSLPAGWVTIMNTGNARNLSDYLSYTGGTTLSYFNSTHEFTSHVSGGSNGATSVPAGESIFIYMASAGTYSDEVWNTTAVTSSMDLTNQTNSDWNVMCNRNGSQTAVTLQRLDNELNTAYLDTPQNNTNANITSMSYIDWDVPKNIPFKANWSINNDTSVAYGECVWMYLGEASLSSQQLDWNALS